MTNDLLSDQIDMKQIETITRELRRVIGFGIRGDVVEFGCYVGTTSVYLAKTILDTDKKLFVYDSFEGLPEKTKEDVSSLGEPFKAGELCAPKKQFINNIIKAKVPMPRIKKAWFSELIGDDLPEKISFAFLDGDYYESIKTSLKLIEPKLSPDAVIIVHDYGNQALPGAAKAVDEWLAARPHYKKRIERSLAIIYNSK